MAEKRGKRPVSIITGFLGSGKTTLLSHVLHDEVLQNTAVLVNEFGKVALDHLLVRTAQEQTRLLGGGCVCCGMREDLVNELRDLLNQDQRGEIPPLVRVVVETTGLADPAPIVFTILADPILQHHFHIEHVIATVDAVNGLLHLDRQSESVKQVAVADRVVITKTDLAGPAQVEKLLERVRAINPLAEVIRAEFGQVEAERLFASNRALPPARPGLTGHDLTGQGAALQIPRPAGSHRLGSRNPTRSISITFDGPLDWTAFGVWLSMLLHARGQEVLRVKGLVDVGEAGPVVLNGVQHVIHPPRHLGAWPDADHSSRLIFIMQGIEPMDLLHSLKAFQNILGAEASVLDLEVWT